MPFLAPLASWRFTGFCFPVIMIPNTIHHPEPLFTERALTDIDALQRQILEARRALIVDAATRVFADKGFHRATIKDIAHAAGIADGTIYNYFANKEALLSAILDRLAQQ